MATKIEWTDQTWNPITGCTPISEGCKNCYAKQMANRLRGRYGYSAENPFGITIHQDKMKLPSRWRKPRKIFVSSMGDLFHKDVPGNAIMDVLAQAIENPRHIFLFLTKRPMRMAKILKYDNPLNPISNLWLGVTVENEDNEWRIDELVKIPAAVRFISVEPMLSSVDFGRYFLKNEACEVLHDVADRFPERDYKMVPTGAIDWVICGGETGPGAREMNPDWARGLRDQCQEAEVPFFMKQMSNKDLIPEDLIIREWPDE